jgi:histidyl-tRNA synthetase
MTPIRAVKGMNDVLPDEVARWQAFEAAFRRSMHLASFSEVRTPLVEPTRLFVRAIGDTTDVVEKEMYSFTKHDEELTLRPEGTAGAVRAYVEHGVNNQEPVSRWYYLGAMFRAERPQRGRYRQFYQAGAEIIGDPGPACDAEMIDLLVSLLNDLKIPGISVHINTIGGSGTRQRYRDAVVQALAPKKAALSEDSQRRLETNPLRILDSKDPRDVEACTSVPPITDVLAPEDTAHFDTLKKHLDALGTPYHVDPKLVRGLDYYTRTLFEIKGAKEKLGAGDTLVGGGRYDGMLKDLGGPEAPAIGFAAGIERLLIASEHLGETKRTRAPVFIAPLGEAATRAGLVLARTLRAAGIATEMDGRGASLKAQLRRANAQNAAFALVLGDGELESKTVQVKSLAAHEQQNVPEGDVVAFLKARLGAANEAAGGAA